MKKVSPVKAACICAVRIPPCYVLPVAFHGSSLGSVLSPMGLPVILCGLATTLRKTGTIPHSYHKAA